MRTCTSARTCTKCVADVQLRWPSLKAFRKNAATIEATGHTHSVMYQMDKDFTRHFGVTARDLVEKYAVSFNIPEIGLVMLTVPNTFKCDPECGISFMEEADPDVERSYQGLCAACNKHDAKMRCSACQRVRCNLAAGMHAYAHVRVGISDMHGCMTLLCPYSLPPSLIQLWLHNQVSMHASLQNIQWQASCLQNA